MWDMFYYSMHVICGATKRSVLHVPAHLDVASVDKIGFFWTHHSHHPSDSHETQHSDYSALGLKSTYFLGGCGQQSHRALYCSMQHFINLVQWAKNETPAQTPISSTLIWIQKKEELI